MAVPKRIVILGGGFAGLWAAIGAARKLDELGVQPEAVEVVLVNRDAFHCIRVRNYEADLSPLRVPLGEVLEPVGVRLLEGEVDALDLAGRTVTVATCSGRRQVGYDRLVFALGSRLQHPPVPGLAEHGFDIDTYAAAKRLAVHLESLPHCAESPGRYTVLIVGAGLTGIEAAAEMPERLRDVMRRSGVDRPCRVILVDHHPHAGSDMGDSARPVIEQALAALGIELRLGIDIAAVSPEGVRLGTGETIPAATVIGCAGMRAHPLTALFPVERDRLGRLPVDEFLRVRGAPNVFAAGDAAWARMDHEHVSVMSCQHARPMGRFAGHNVVADLFGLPMLPLAIDWYVTVLDLGPWGAVYTEGWDRRVVATGDVAKRTKREINGRRIYPPLNRDRQATLAAAAPVVQAPPGYAAEPGTEGPMK